MNANVHSVNHNGTAKFGFNFHCWSADHLAAVQFLCAVLHRQFVFRTTMKRFYENWFIRKMANIFCLPKHLNRCQMSTNNWVYGERLCLWSWAFNFRVIRIVHCTFVFEHDTTRRFIGIANDIPFDVPKSNIKFSEFTICNASALFSLSIFQIQNRYLRWWQTHRHDKFVHSGFRIRFSFPLSCNHCDLIERNTVKLIQRFAFIF